MSELFLHEHVPYRICLLGEHVDHQLGETLSANIAIGVRLDFRPDPSGAVHVKARDYGGTASFAPDAIPEKKGHWSDYLGGILKEVRSRHGFRIGFEGELYGEFPSGGLSSSAAVQIAYLAALCRVNGRRLARREAADIVCAAERGFVGVNVGMLDPMTILFADGKRLLHLDYRSMERKMIDRPAASPAPGIAIVYSGIVRTLESSPYNTRIRECAAAANALSAGASVLRQVPEENRKDAESLPHPQNARARHYFSEIDRVHRGIDAWRAGDDAAFASLVDQCGDSCTENFELGTPEMIDLIAILRRVKGVRAARFTGGGFGGSAICLIDPGAEGAILSALRTEYASRHPDCSARSRVAVPGFGRAADPDGRAFEPIE